MDTLTSWLMAMVQPIVVRVMTSLGLSVITFAGVSEAFEQAVGYVQQGVNGLPVKVLELASMVGMKHALGLILGALSFSLTLMAIRKAFSFFGLGALAS